MKERKITIIDKTIVVLKEVYGERLKEKMPKVRELIKLLDIIGTDYIEITQELYEELLPLPKNIKFIIANNNKAEVKNTIELYNMLRGKANICNLKNVRIIGLDDLIFYNYKKIFSKIIDVFGENIELCIKNEYECATAMSLEWLRSGGKKVVTSFAGIGSYAPLEEVLGSLSYLEKVNLHGNHKLFPEALSLFEDITERTLEGNMPFIGKDIFNVESGIHVNGIAKNPRTYEPYDPSEIGRKRNIIIGKHSGVNALEIKLRELNIQYKQNNLKIMLDNVRELSTQKRRGLNNEEIEEIYKKCYI